MIGGFYGGGRSRKGNLIFIWIDESDVNDLVTVAGKDWARCCSLGLVGSEKVGAWSIVSMRAPSPGNINDCKKNIISVKYKVAETNSLGLYGSLQHALLSFVIRLAPPPSTPPTPHPHTLLHHPHTLPRLPLSFPTAASLHTLIFYLHYLFPSFFLRLHFGKSDKTLLSPAR